MKKTWMSLIAAVAFCAPSALAAPCVSGQLSGLVGSTCEVTNGGFTWTLSNFGFTGSSLFGSSNPTASDLNVVFTPVGYSGFSVTYNVATSIGNWLSSDYRQWTNRLWVTAGNAQSNVQSVYLGVSGVGGTSDLSVNKEIQDQTAAILHPNLAFVYVNGTATTSDAQTLYFLNAPNLSINDKIITNSISRLRSGSITSYTNTFVSETPEPATWAMIGLGLVGVAALRRPRKS
jgi:PEP-CTERM motif